jgi:hypothetical protein
MLRNRYGEPGKKTRAKKANRLPPGVSYTVSAIPPDELAVAGPSGIQSGRGSGDRVRGGRGGCVRGGSCSGRGTGGRSSIQGAFNLYSSSSEDEDESLRRAVDEIVATDYLGADESEESSSDTSDSSDEENSDNEMETESEKEKQKKNDQQKENKEQMQKESEMQKEKQMRKENQLQKETQLQKEKQMQDEKEKQQQKKKGKEKKKTGDEQEQTQEYQVGEFVVAVYEGQWLLAQVDINQDKAGSSHVNLTYMEKVGDNQFKWPKHDDLLLTLKEDILFRCTTPVLVGSSIRASNVGLSNTEAIKADAALDLVRLSSSKFYLPLLVILFLKELYRYQYQVFSPLLQYTNTSTILCTYGNS